MDRKFSKAQTFLAIKIILPVCAVSEITVFNTCMGRKMTSYYISVSWKGDLLDSPCIVETVRNLIFYAILYNKSSGIQNIRNKFNRD